MANYKVYYDYIKIDFKTKHASKTVECIDHVYSQNEVECGLITPRIAFNYLTNQVAFKGGICDADVEKNVARVDFNDNIFGFDEIRNIRILEV